MSRPPGPVALLFHEGQGSGASMVMLRVLPELRERGWEFQAYVDRPSRLASLLEEQGIPVEGRPRHVGFSLRWMRHDPGLSVKLRSLPPWFGGLAAWLRRTKPALVHANSLYSLPDAMLARALGYPTFLQLMEMLPDGRKGAMARTVVHRAGLQVGAVSEACARRFAGSGPLPHVVPTGVPLPGAVERPPGNGKVVVGTMGYVCRRKGTDVFVDAAALVLERRPDVEFRIIGGVDPVDPEPAWAAGVLSRAAGLGIRHIEGADGLSAMRELDVFALASRQDPYPLVVMEAMGSGVPVVATAVDGIPEQVVPGTGELTAADDPRDLADRILELVEDEPRRRQFGAAAREHALATFRLDRQADAQELAWHATAAGSRRRP